MPTEMKILTNSPSPLVVTCMDRTKIAGDRDVVSDHEGKGRGGLL